MEKRFPRRLASIQAGTKGQGDGHADDEQEGRKDQIDKGHATLSVEMLHPGRDDGVGDAGEVVDEDHAEHDEAAQGIDGENPFLARARNTRRLRTGGNRGGRATHKAGRVRETSMANRNLRTPCISSPDARTVTLLTCWLSDFNQVGQVMPAS